jgi:hypothetical protein
MTAPQWFSCNYCHLQRLGLGPVHGDEPCPMKAKESLALIEMLGAQTDSYNRSAFMANDAVAMMRKITGAEEDE